VWQWEVLLAPCAGHRYLSVCLLGSAGMLYGQSEGLLISDGAHAPRIAVGTRLAVEYPLTKQRLRLRAALDLTIAATQTHFSVGETEVWASSRGAALLGLGLIGDYFQ
jgi:hypothetical protein